MRASLVGRLLLALAVGGFSPVSAQVVRGLVTDSATGQPVAGAGVSLLARRAGLARGKTQEDGSYELAAPAPGRYRVQFTMPGYRLLITPEFQVRAGESVDFSFRASALAAVALDTATIEGRPVPRYLAPFYQRRARGMGKFVTREEFERYFPQQVTDIMRRAQAFDILPNAGRGLGSDTRTVIITSHRAVGVPYGPVGGECPPLIFLDGTLVGNARDADIDALLAVGIIEAMEFYEGGVEVPGEFAVNGSNCGVVAAWSRMQGGEGPSAAHRVEVGSQVGGRVVGSGLEAGRAGLQASVGIIGRLEVHTALNLYLTGLRGSAAPLTGWQVTLALRVRPLGGATPWYLGVGGVSTSLREQTSNPYTTVMTDDHQVLLTGINLPVFFLRPLLEVNWLDPLTPSRSQLQVFTGFTVRLQ